MRKLGLLACLAVVSVLVLSPLTPALAVAKTHDVNATVVSVDLKAKELTIKDEAGSTKTAPVIGQAVKTLKTLKAGDRITATCQDSAEGKHQGISKITMAEEEKTS